MFKRQKNPYQTNNQDFVASFSAVKERLILTPMRKESSKLQGTEQKMRTTFGSFKQVNPNRSHKDSEQVKGIELQFCGDDLSFRRPSHHPFEENHQLPINAPQTHNQLQRNLDIHQYEVEEATLKSGYLLQTRRILQKHSDTLRVELEEALQEQKQCKWLMSHYSSTYARCMEKEEEYKQKSKLHDKMIKKLDRLQKQQMEIMNQNKKYKKMESLQLAVLKQISSILKKEKKGLQMAQFIEVLVSKQT